jgi:hypothetical protein
MTRDQLLAMLGRKSVTWLSGGMAFLWAGQKYPDLFKGDNLIALCSAVLLIASAKLSADNEKNGKGPKLP